MSSQGPSHFPDKMNVVTLENEKTKLEEWLRDFKEEGAVVLVGEEGTGKTWIAREIVDAAVRAKLYEQELFSGGLWFYLNKKYDDEETFLLEVAYQLSLLSTRRVSNKGKDGKPGEKRVKKEVEEEKKKEKELFWASEVPGYEDEQEKEEEEEIHLLTTLRFWVGGSYHLINQPIPLATSDVGHSPTERTEQKGDDKKNDQKPTSQNSADAVVKDPPTEEGGEKEKDEEAEKSRKEKDAKRKKLEKLQEEEKQKKKKEEEERVKKLKLKVSALLSNKKYLLVLDGYRPRSKEDGGELTKKEIWEDVNSHYKQIMSKLEMYVRETRSQFPKILITVSSTKWDNESDDGPEKSEIQAADNVESSTAGGDKDGNFQVRGGGEDVQDIKGEPGNPAKRNARLLKWDDSLETENVKEVKITKLPEEDCTKFFLEKSGLNGNPRKDQLSKFIFLRSNGLPAAVLLMAKALKHIADRERCAMEGKNPEENHGEWSLERAIDRVINYQVDEGPVAKKANEDLVSKISDGDSVPRKADGSPAPREDDEDHPVSIKANKSLFRCGYDMLPSDLHANCCWYSRKLFKERGTIHYNELISYWIMEGFLGTDNCARKSYNKAFKILTDLLKLGMFDWREDNLVTMERQALDVPDDRGHDISVTASLGLVTLFGKDPVYDLGRMALANGMLKTPCHDRAMHMVTTLLMDQNRLCRDVPQDLFLRMQDLQTLVLLNPILEKLPKSLFGLKKVQILVLRGCEQLKKVDGIQDMLTLKVLEISGAASLDEIPDDFFEKMTQLICLNLSGSGITSVPSPSENSKDARPTLRWLILRGCPRLEELPSMSNFEKLEVLDLCGSASFGKIKDNFFISLAFLQTINLSGTRIHAFPIVGPLTDLRRLLFKDCKKLRRIPRFPVHITHLDLSGCCKLLEFRDETLVEKEKLKTIKASHTRIDALPTIPMPPKLAYLGLDHVVKVEGLTPKTVVQNLELFDVSAADERADVRPDLFDDLRNIQVLKLSGTKVTSLRSLPNTNSLHQLILSGCGDLKELPKMDVMIKLEVLDLSQCAALGEEEIKHLDRMSRLRELNLSGAWKSTEFNVSEVLGQMTSLQKLDLSENQQLVGLKDMSKLEMLSDLSLKNCKLYEDLASVKENENLQVLDLSGTSVASVPEIHANSKSKLRVLDLSRTKLTEFPYDKIQELNKLKRLNLPNMENIKWSMISDTNARLPEELTFDEHGIFEVADAQGGSAGQIQADNSKLPENPTSQVANALGGSTSQTLPGGSNLREQLASEVANAKACSIHQKPADGSELPEEPPSKVANAQGGSAGPIQAGSSKLPENPTSQVANALGGSTSQTLPGGSNLREQLASEVANAKAGSMDQKPADGSELPEELPSEVANAQGDSAGLIPADSSKLPENPISEVANSQGGSTGPIQADSSKLQENPTSKVANAQGDSTSPIEAYSSKLLENPTSEVFNAQGGSNGPIQADSSKLPENPTSEVVNAQGGSKGPIQADSSKLPENPTSEVVNAQGGSNGPIQADSSKLPENPTSEVVNAQGGSNGPMQADSSKLRENPTSEVANTQGGSIVQINEGVSKFAVGSIKQHSEEELLNCYDKTLISVLQTLKYSLAKPALHPIEAHGVDAFPDACRSLLKSSEYLSVVDTSSKSLSQLGPGIMKDMKGCWLDRCPNMESVITVESVEEVVPGERAEEVIVEEDKLEFLWLSNLPRLKTMYNKEGTFKCFQNLKTLYLDCCPKLTYVFSLSQVPENLADLEIRFCDKLTTVFKDDESGRRNLNLKKLRLFMLPELVSISLSQVLEKLEDLEISFCDKLTTVFKDDESGRLNLNLKKLGLFMLPELVSIGANLPPNVQKDNYAGCPKLPKANETDKVVAAGAEL